MATHLLEGWRVERVVLQLANERNDLVRLRVGVRGCPDAVERDKGQPAEPLGIHDLHQARGGRIRVDDDVEE
jgi:hypothetical protein